MSDFLTRWREQIASIDPASYTMTRDYVDDMTTVLEELARVEVFKAYFQHLLKGAPIPQEEYEPWWAELERLDGACRIALDARSAAQRSEGGT